MGQETGIQKSKTIDIEKGTDSTQPQPELDVHYLQNNNKPKVSTVSQDCINTVEREGESLKTAVGRKVQDTTTDKSPTIERARGVLSRKQLTLDIDAFRKHRPRSAEARLKRAYLRQ